MNERLHNLRYKLGLEWGELAHELGISRSMLGFIRREVKKPSAKLLHRIVELENQFIGNPVVGCNELYWKKRAEEAERKLVVVNESLKFILKGTQKLQEIL